MTDPVSRRMFLSLVPAAAAVPVIRWSGIEQGEPLPASFPSQDPSHVKEIVTVAHGDLARVKALVEKRPALARAAWDWGYGDWETALGAASHMGNREIAAVLLANGAHPTIFSAAMLGQLDAVKAFIAASPGIQRTRGPHGITLLAHARNGRSAEVVAYLESLGDADPRYENLPLAAAERDAVLGTYAFGPAAADRLTVRQNSRGDLTIVRDGGVERNLFHHGKRVFNPAGAEAVRITFSAELPRAARVAIEDGEMTVRATRSA
ncbi:MAG TPA: hypothetical protein VF147_12780 [Vicinamibacterales bacterium]